jgi:hypothetical protein
MGNTFSVLCLGGWVVQFMERTALQLEEEHSTGCFVRTSRRETNKPMLELILPNTLIKQSLKTHSKSTFYLKII